RLRRRAGMLLRAQTNIYAALGLFVAAALVSVVGAALGSTHPFGYRVAAITSLGIGSGAAVSLVAGCTLLVRETPLALQSVSQETALLEARMRPPSAACEKCYRRGRETDPAWAARGGVARGVAAGDAGLRWPVPRPQRRRRRRWRCRRGRRRWRCRLGRRR